MNRPNRPKPKDEGLSVRATEGTGSVTVGVYGPDIAGPPLAGGKGAYFQVYHSEGVELQNDRIQGLRTRGREGDLVGQPDDGLGTDRDADSGLHRSHPTASR